MAIRKVYIEHVEYAHAYFVSKDMYTNGWRVSAVQTNAGHGLHEQDGPKEKRNFYLYATLNIGSQPIWEQ